MFETGLWQRPDRIGYVQVLSGLGGIVAPLLAGFSLATIGVLVTASRPPRLAEWAILAFSGSAATMLYEHPVAFLALGRDPAPMDRLAWYPEATVSRRSLEWVRTRQAPTSC